MTSAKRKVKAVQVEVPTVKLGVIQGKKTKPKPKVKVKAKAKSKPKAKPKAKRKSRPRPVATDRVPAAMAPPEMPDTRPVRGTVPTPDLSGINAASDIDMSKHDNLGLSRETVPTMPGNAQLVQGAQCTWLGPASSAGKDSTGIPTCPHCGGHLLTSPDRATVELGFEQFELGAYPVTPTHKPKRHPGYVDFMHWMMEQSTCWTSIEQAASDYLDETGKVVDPLP